MKQVYLIFLMLFGVTFTAQSQILQAIGAGGTYTESSGGSVSWTLGEVVIVTASGSSNDATQGFQQGNLFVTGIEELQEISVNIYPNPASEYVTIQCVDPVKVTIYDISGRLVASHDFYNEINQINVSDFSRGTYNLVIESAGRERRTAQLVVM